MTWYPSLSAFIKGIEKNGFAFSQYSFPILFTFFSVIILIFLGFTVAPVMSHSMPVISFTVTSMAIYLFSIRYQMKKLMDMNFLKIMLFPLAFVVLPMIFIRAALLVVKRGGIIWRGTFYSLKSLRSNQRMKLANLVFSFSAEEPVMAAVLSEPRPVQFPLRDEEPIRIRA